MLESKGIKYPIMYLASRKVAQKSKEEVSVLILPLLSSAFNKELHYFLSHHVIICQERELEKMISLWYCDINFFYVYKKRVILSNQVLWSDEMLETDTGKFQDIFFMSIGNSVISARNTGDLSRSSFSFFFFSENTGTAK